MTARTLLNKFGQPGANKARLAELVIQRPELLSALLNGLTADQARIRFGCAALLEIISRKEPSLLYSQFDFFAAGLDWKNTILKWMALRILANLAQVDSAQRFEAIFIRYFAPIRGPEMITAATIIQGGACIAQAKPHLAGRIAAEVLKVSRAKYKTAECRNVAIGHAITSFHQFFSLINAKAAVLRFVRKQLRNPRPAVRRKAEGFLRHHQPSTINH